MELRYNTAADDYLVLVRHYLERSVMGKRFVAFAWVAISSLAWLSVILPYLKLGVVDAGFVVRAAFATAIAVGFPFLYKWYNDSVFGQLINERSMQGVAGATTLVATAEFIEQRTATTSARAAWRDVLGIVSTKQHELVSLAPLVTILVSASAFASALERQQFQQQLRQWLEDARPIEPDKLS